MAVRSIAVGNALKNEIYSHARRPQTGVSLRQLLEFGSNPTPKTLIKAAHFLHHELPIRLAHRVRDLDDLPYGLSDMPSVHSVKNWYIQSFYELLKFPKIQTSQDERHFTELIASIKDRHAGTLFAMARGVWELKKHLYKKNQSLVSSPQEVDLTDMYEIHKFLDAFYMSRIGIRMLIGQHIALHEHEPGWVGCICESTSPAEVALAAIDSARHVCMRQYGEAPEVSLFGHTDLTIPFIPSHLHHILFEVLKNSMRAVCEFHGIDNELPPIRIVIADAEQNEDVCIKISDEGGGIPRSQMHRIWSYMFTTADSNAFEMLDEVRDFGMDAPLAGLGYGLPISRLFARYFGGDLQVISMEGYGTDAYLHITRIGDAEEPLP